MNKFITTLILALICVNVFAQLNITSTNSESEKFFKDTWVSITWNGHAFMLNSSDPRTGMTLPLTLGRTKDSALLSLKQILEWFNTAENKSSITLEQNGQSITLFKQDNQQIFITTGDAEYAQKEYSRVLSNAIVGVKKYDKKESTPHFSYILRKALTKSIEKIEQLTDPKYSPVDVETAQDASPVADTQ